MTKMIRVSSCRHCPRFLCHNCGESRGDVKDYIPDGCPLEDDMSKRYAEFRKLMATELDKRCKSLTAQCKAGERNSKKIKRLEAEIKELKERLND